MADAELTPEIVSDVFGGIARAIEPNPDEIEIALALITIREQLSTAAKEEGMGVNKLASCLQVSPSVVSRLLKSEGDMRVSTAVLFARAVNRSWRLVLERSAVSTVEVRHVQQVALESDTREAIFKQHRHILNYDVTAGNVQIQLVKSGS